VTDLIGYVIRGIPFGCIFALVAIGLVLTYKTSGVFNLAFGAQAFFSAAVYFDTRIRHDWANLPAFVLAVFIVGPVTGFVLYRLLYRHLRTAPAVAGLVTSIGLLVAGPEIVKLWFGQSATFGPPTVWPWPNEIYRFGDYAINANEAATIVFTGVAVLILGALFRWSAIGLQMRAVVESPRMTELAGINADRVSTFSWMLSSLFAALAGVLLAPLFAQVAAYNFTILIVAAIAAAAFGRLTSIPLAVLGGILLGVAQGLLAGYLPTGSLLANGLRPSLPFVALFLLLIFLPGLRQGRELGDPLAGVDPPPAVPVAVDRSRFFTILTRAFAITTITLALLFCLFVFDSYWLNRFSIGVVYGVIFLSFTVFTGMGGQVSLCQAAFAGMGAFTTAQLVDRFDMPVLTTLILGVTLAAFVGALLAIPALRLGGIFLSLATLAFALMYESVLVPLDWVSGGAIALRVPRPVIGPIDFANDKAFFLLCVALLAGIALLVIFVRQGTTGRYLDALRGSEVASSAIGINPARSRIIAFALSAGIAGLGGGLFAMQTGHATSALFSPFIGLFWVVLVLTLGARSPQGAITAGMALVLMPELLKGLGVAPSWQLILFGLGAINYAKHPEGVIEPQTRASIEFLQRKLDERKQRRAGPLDLTNDDAEIPASGTEPVSTAP
jgi:branched-subunit amino acid ABC-type transport system permease component